MKLITFLALATMAFAAIPPSLADEVNDLIETILEASPQERAKVANYQSANTKKKAPAKKKTTPAAESKPVVPDLGIPDDQVFDAAAKFPKDIVGKYIYGPVTLKSIFGQNGEAEIHITSKNMRSFLLYTSDPDVVAAFNGGWGAKYMIPRSCPLRIVGIKGPGMYSVRMAYDPDTTGYTIQEELQQKTQGILNRFQDRMKNATGNLQDALEGR
jgi:hypothetical protein